MKPLNILGAAVALFLPFAAYADDASTVEVMLASELDESRGYCLDIAGGKGADAPLNRGLQAHTCYHYTGVVLEDQGFDLDAISDGEFRIPYFDVCMAASSVAEGSSFVLEECDQSATQQFTLQSSGQLVTASNPELCVTVSSTEKYEGRGATPVHVMRPLTLQSCSDAGSEYQTWTLNSL